MKDGVMLADGPRRDGTRRLSGRGFYRVEFGRVVALHVQGREVAKRDAAKRRNEVPPHSVSVTPQAGFADVTRGVLCQPFLQVLADSQFRGRDGAAAVNLR